MVSLLLAALIELIVPCQGANGKYPLNCPFGNYAVYSCVQKPNGKFDCHHDGWRSEQEQCKTARTDTA